MVSRNWKMVVFWVAGSISILFGALIAGNLQSGLGVSTTGFLLALMMAFILILLGGLLWISVALAVKKVSEE